jgi:redox-sensitive bicupin YhaK (pirin superfamily)
VIRIVRQNEHFHHEEDWLSTYWHFSFDTYRDPANMSFGPLRVFNDDVIDPGKGFGFHPHRDMEIITYVIDGELEHRDDKGGHDIIHAGEVQRMTAGSGIVHSERNHSSEKPLRLLQMWIFPNRRNLEPSWEQQKFTTQERKDRLLPVVVEEGKDSGSAVHIHQDALMYVSSLGAGRQVEHALPKGRKAYLFVIDGGITVNGQKMHRQDAARIEGESRLTIKADRDSELILVDLPENFNVNN